MDTEVFPFILSFDFPLPVKKCPFFCTLRRFLALKCPTTLRQDKKDTGKGGSRVPKGPGTRQPSTNSPPLAARSPAKDAQAQPWAHTRNSQGKTMPVWFSSLLLARSHRRCTLFQASPRLTARGLRGYKGPTAASRGGARACAPRGSSTAGNRTTSTLAAEARRRL